MFIVIVIIAIALWLVLRAQRRALEAAQIEFGVALDAARKRRNEADYIKVRDALGGDDAIRAIVENAEREAAAKIK